MQFATLRSRRNLTAATNANAPRSEQTAAINDLNLGPEPDHIDRQLFSNDGGFIGPNFQDGYPYDGSAETIPHIPTPRKPLTVSSFDKTIDVTVTAPSIFVGSPS